ncbi:MAG: RluA family pseudouridine synthase [bacterium]
MSVQGELGIYFSILENFTQRVDVFLSSLFSVSRAKIQKNIALENLSVNGITVKKNSFNRFTKGMEIEFEMEPVEELHVCPEKMDLNIVFENENFLILNKPAGLVVHPGAGNHNGTLINGIMHYFNLKNIEAKGNSRRPWLVHRLDKNTSGLLVVAKTSTSFEELTKIIAERKILREYVLIVNGHLKTPKGTVTTFHGRDPLNRLKFSPNVNIGKKAVTHYEVITEYKYCSLVKATLETGRTHQIRMHFSYLGHPIVNDSLYGGEIKTANPALNKKLSLAPRQLLHAKTLQFELFREKYLFELEIPEDMRNILNSLENISGG